MSKAKFQNLAKTGVALAAAALLSVAHSQTLTTFTLDTGVTGVATGTFQIRDGSLFNLGQLSSPGVSTYNYASQLFTPSSTGTYTFGMSSAGFDSVLILYTGLYDPTAPGTNAIALNDDSDGQGAGGVTMGTCGGSAGLCPKLTENLTGGTDYYVVVSSFGSGTAVPLPIGFYVFGAPVGVGGAPPPALLSVLGSSQALTNSPSYGAARVIDDTAGLLALFTGAGLVGDQQISDAASQTLPLLVGSSQLAAANALSGINRIIQARLDGNRGLSAGDTFYGDRHFWIKPFGSWAKQSSQGAVAGFKASTGGMAIGMDGTISENTRVGVAFAWANSSVKGRSTVAPASASVDVYQLVGYGSHALKNGSELDFQVDVGRNNNAGLRTIEFTNTTAGSRYNSDSFHVGLGWGKVMAVDEKTSYSPSIRLDFTRIRDSGYTETGAGLLNLNVPSRTTRALVLGGDAKLNHQLTSATALSLNAGIGYDFESGQALITSAFAGAPSAAFVTAGIRPDPWIARAGLGLLHKTQAGTEITARLDVEKRSGFQNGTASVNARWSF